MKTKFVLQNIVGEILSNLKQDAISMKRLRKFSQALLDLQKQFVNDVPTEEVENCLKQFPEFHTSFSTILRQEKKPQKMRWSKNCANTFSKTKTNFSSV